MTRLEIAVLASGCFWCTEPVFSQLKGVKKVSCGYTGGYVTNPSYQQISSGTSGHAEAVQIIFDSSMITFESLLKIFFSSHNPSRQIDRTGNAFTDQYRSEIFFQNEVQKTAALNMINELNHSGNLPAPIITQVTPAQPFYLAEHYFSNNPNQEYCMSVAVPKVAQIRTQYTHLVR